MTCRKVGKRNFDAEIGVGYLDCEEGSGVMLIYDGGEIPTLDITPESLRTIVERKLRVDIKILGPLRVQFNVEKIKEHKNGP